MDPVAGVWIVVVSGAVSALLALLSLPSQAKAWERSDAVGRLATVCQLLVAVFSLWNVWDCLRLREASTIHMGLSVFTMLVMLSDCVLRWKRQGKDSR